jgi:hypothetical protein
MRQQHIDAWNPLVTKPGNGIWAPACIIHTMSQWNWMDSQWQVPERSGNTMSAAVAEFLAGGTSDFSDKVGWPDNSRCASFN